MTKKNKNKRLLGKQKGKSDLIAHEQNKKAKKEKINNLGLPKSGKKDAGVPFKENIHQDLKKLGQQKCDEKIRRKEAIELQRLQAREKALEDKRFRGLEGLVADAARKQFEHDSALQFRQEVKNKVTDRSAKAFYKEFIKVMESADVILQVLDARDPMGTRCKEVEMAVLNSSKRLVLVLNKADLVPKENLESWVKYLRGELPVIAFKSSTQNQSSRLGHSKVSIEKSSDSQLNTSKCVGASTLMSLLSNYCRNKDVKTSIRVGVVGLPNVGKSSLINSLKRNRACSVGAMPGVTKNMQEVLLDSKIKLLDSPGMILASGNMSDAGVALRNAIKVDTMDDPLTPVRAILQRCHKQQMMLHYHITDYSSVDEFLSLVARGIGKLKRGGIPDQAMAARMVLNDWNTGKIKYFTHPPEAETRSTHISAEIVSSYSKEFSLDDLDKMEEDEWQNLPNVLPSQTMLIQSSGIVDDSVKQEETMETDDSDDEDDDAQSSVDDNEGQLSSKVVVAGKVPKISKPNDDDNKIPLFKEEGMIRLKKVNKMREKKERKDRRRRDKVAAALSHSMEAAFEALNSGD